MRRSVEQAWNVGVLREMARRALPRLVFDFIDGGAEDERTLRRNESAFGEIRLWPRPLEGVTEPATAVSLFGYELSLPIVVAPTGLTSLLWPRGEVEIGTAVAAARCAYAVSTAATCPIEEVAAAAPGRTWFQFYLTRDRGLAAELLERAATSQCRVLVLTTDTPVLGQRERDLANGFTVPPALRPATLADIARHPGWLWRHRLRPDRVTFAHFAGRDGRRGVVELARHVQSMFEPRVGWREVEWVRSRWNGPLLLKGILHPDEAARAVGVGADGLIVSNHGGRQLDGVPASIEALAPVAERIAGQVPLLLDGGVRRGSDIVKALALGARACMVGRPVLYGLAAGGHRGAARALAILGEELRRAMILAGLPSVAAIGPHCVAPAVPPGARAASPIISGASGRPPP